MKKTFIMIMVVLTMLSVTGCSKTKGQLKNELLDAKNKIVELKDEIATLNEEKYQLEVEKYDAIQERLFAVADLEKLKRQINSSTPAAETKPAEVKATVVQANLADATQAQVLVSLIFSPDGDMYEAKKPNWYSTAYCTDKDIVSQDIILYSKNYVKLDLPNGNTSYVYLSSTGNFVYSTRPQSLRVIK